MILGTIRTTCIILLQSWFAAEYLIFFAGIHTLMGAVHSFVANMLAHQLFAASFSRWSVDDADLSKIRFKTNPGREYYIVCCGSAE